MAGDKRTQEQSMATVVLEKTGLILKVAVGLIIAIIYSFITSFTFLIPRVFRRHDITGKVALVTGGGSGIGRLLCLNLARKGAKVITWDVNEKGNDETVRLIKTAGYDCTAYTVDLCDRKAIYRSADLLKAKNIKVDILVNNAGIVTGKNFMDNPDELVEKTFQVNVLSHFWMVKAFLPAMCDSNSGQVVTVASLAGKVGINKLIDYCSSKFAAVGFDESLRAELMVNNYDGVHTTCICPYYIDTGMFEGVKSTLLPLLKPQYVADEILDAILLRSKEVNLPFYQTFFIFLKFFINPSLLYKLLELVGMTESMDEFKGRNQQKKQK